LQLLFTSSEEGGLTAGLAFCPAASAAAARTEVSRTFGWNILELASPCTVFKGIPDGAGVFILSTLLRSAGRTREVVAATTEYGIKFWPRLRGAGCSACSFHPEKSTPSA
jgi:glutamine amidotransferase